MKIEILTDVAGIGPNRRPYSYSVGEHDVPNDLAVRLLRSGRIAKPVREEQDVEHAVQTTVPRRRGRPPRNRAIETTDAA